MSATNRLERYLARIGLAGPLVPDLATLRAIHAAHVRTIAFEGLDSLLGRPVSLDAEAVTAKLIDGRRGGYCFEQNGLLADALGTLGYAITGLGARVRWMSPPESPLGPRTHRLLKVDLPDGTYIADVGFGANVLDAPLRLETGIEQPTAMGTYRLDDEDGLLWLRAKRPDGWRTMYVFDLVPQLQSDYEIGNWWTSTSPLTPFTGNLVMERLAGTTRHKLANRRLSAEDRDGCVLAERVIEDADDLARVLDEVFGVTPPEPAAQILARIDV